MRYHRGRLGTSEGFICLHIWFGGDGIRRGTSCGYPQNMNEMYVYFVDWILMRVSRPWATTRDCPYMREEKKLVLRKTPRKYMLHQHSYRQTVHPHQ